jgi:hypothetical protein
VFQVLDFIKQIVKQCQHNHKQASALRHKEHIVRLSTIVTDMEAVLAAVESESRSLSAGGPVATSASSDHCARAVSLACESVSLLTRSQTQSVGSDPKAETNLARDAEVQRFSFFQRNSKERTLKIENVLCVDSVLRLLCRSLYRHPLVWIANIHSFVQRVSDCTPRI